MEHILRYFLIGTLGSLATGLISCKSVNAVVNCPDISSYESREGVYNANKFSLGHVMILNTQNKQAFPMGRIAPENHELDTTKKTEQLDQDAEVGFDIAFDAEVKDQVKASLESVISQEYSFKLYNTVRVGIQNPIDFFNKSDMLNSVRNIYKEDTTRNIIIGLVSAILEADSLRIQLKDKSKLNSSATVKDIADVKISYTYNCAGDIFASGESVPLFWKAVILKYSPSQDKMLPYTDMTIKFRGYNFILAN